jgi:hypothetical protein
MENVHRTEVARWSRGRLVFAGFVILAAIALAFEHRLHLVPWLPWLLLLACPLMHLFHHGGHGHRHGNGEDKP